MSIEEFMAKDRRAVEEAWCKGNIDALNETHSPDIIVHGSPLPDVKGLEAYKQTFLALRQGFTDLRVEWGKSVCEGDTIAEQYTMHMKHTGVNPMFPAPATGKEVTLKGTVFLHMKNDKIVEEFEYVDFLGFLQQLGLVPPMGQQ